MPATARTREECELYVESGDAAAAGLHLHAPQCHLDERCQGQDAVPEKPPYKGVPHTVEMVVEMITMENAGLQCDDNNMAKEGQT